MFKIIASFMLIFTLQLIAEPSFKAIPTIKIANQKKYQLGEELFFNPNLSSDKTIACASCHNFSLGGADNNAKSFGVKGRVGSVNTPTIFNTRFNIDQDWIGLSKTINKKSIAAFLNHNEMNGDINNVIIYIRQNKSLKDKFIKLYGKINKNTIFNAISYYVENLTTPNSKFDKFLNGDKTVLNEDEKKGFKLFKKYGCVSCHNGINIGGNMYQKIGIFSNINFKNKGKYKISHNKLDLFVFKVPSLRNITKTAPYLHNGKIFELKKVIYKMGEYQLGIKIPNDDINFIALFLKTLEGEIPNEYQ
ncbi:MAG: c-type cytochrome [Campylobacteraceae bacterium]|nr:c-type cytochrome [Campylobacteraceae bacterium]